MSPSFKPLSLVLLILLQASPVQSIHTYVQFDQSDSNKSSIEVPDSRAFSVNTTGSLTVAAWMRPDTLDFKYTEGNGYVHWLGKGEGGRDEWVFRMYNSSNSQNRVNRISFYVLNLTGGEGIGSYFEYPTNTPSLVRAGEWIFVVGVVDGKTNTTSIYRDGAFVRCDKYYGDSIVSIQGKPCQHYPRYDPVTKEAWIVPKHGSAPLLIGRSGYVNPPSFFQGGISEVRIWSRPLNSTEVQNLYASGAIPSQGLVAQYLFDESSGNIAHDTVGGHDGKVVGTSWRWGSGSETVTPTKTLTHTSTVSSTTTATTQTSSTGVNTIGPGIVVVVVLGAGIILAIVAAIRRLRK